MTIKKISNSFLYLFLLFKIINDFFPVITKTIPMFNQMVSFLLFFLLIIHKELIVYEKIRINKIYLTAYLILIFWSIYSLLSGLWSINLGATLNQSNSIISFLLSFFIITQLIDTQQKLENMNKLFLIIFIAYLIISVWEMTTFSHLPTSKAVIDGRFTNAPYGPFFNRNNFASILLLIFPLIIFGLRKSKGKIFIPILILFMVIIFFVQGARIAILALSFFIIVNIFYSTKTESLISLILILITLFLYNHFKDNKLLILAKKGTISEIVSLNYEIDSYKQSSMKQRKYLGLSAIEMFFESKMCGVGSGNFENNMTPLRKSKTAGIINSHNFFMEILATNGLLVAMLLFFLFVYVLINLLRIYKKDKDALGLILVLILLIPASILPSSFFRFFHFWNIFAYICSYIALKNQEFGI